MDESPILRTPAIILPRPKRPIPSRRVENKKSRVMAIISISRICGLGSTEMENRKKKKAESEPGRLLPFPKYHHPLAPAQPTNSMGYLTLCVT